MGEDVALTRTSTLKARSAYQYWVHGMARSQEKSGHLPKGWSQSSSPYKVLCQIIHTRMSPVSRTPGRLVTKRTSVLIGTRFVPTNFAFCSISFLHLPDTTRNPPNSRHTKARRSTRHPTGRHHRATDSSL